MYSDWEKTRDQMVVTLLPTICSKGLSKTRKIFPQQQSVLRQMPPKIQGHVLTQKLTCCVSRFILHSRNPRLKFQLKDRLFCQGKVVFLGPWRKSRYNFLKNVP